MSKGRLCKTRATKHTLNTYLQINAIPAPLLLHTYLPASGDGFELRQRVRLVHDRRIAIDLLLLELEDHLELLVLRQHVRHQDIEVMVSKRCLSHSHNAGILAQHLTVHLLQKLVHTRTVRAVFVRPLELLAWVLDAGVW